MFPDRTRCARGGGAVTVLFALGDYVDESAGTRIEHADIDAVQIVSLRPSGP